MTLYRPTAKQGFIGSRRCKKILSLASEKGEITPSLVSEVLTLRLPTAEIELKYLEKEGFLSEVKEW